ncbi:LuxR family transcriptional regulator [Dethiosulfatarculus sandiegensis]|uniref:LuxR family transcriptional regulator n=1 Tax=Dethiosulfatarculus sandiegensis TaxID=1429043 RepID=A0A0D2JXI5_9BACT|nr:LuxR family transcriptional regulator [Dethiosulfatarculus sandiegensis]
MRVILADDHTLVRKGLIALLDDTDIQVVGDAEDGREVLEKAAQLEPDVVVMDISMPSLNGLEATRQLKKSLPKTKVLILTMHSNEEYVYETLRAGASGYLIKRSAPRELIAAIKAAHRGEYFLSPSISATVIQKYLQQAAGDSEPAPPGFTALTPREREVIQLIAEGLSNPQIADQLCVSLKTVKTHRSNLMEKLDLHNTAEITRYAIHTGLISVD